MAGIFTKRIWQPWASEIFPGGPLGDFSQIFPGVAKNGEI